MIASLIFALATPKLSTVTGVMTLNGKPVKDAVIWMSGSGKSKPLNAEIVQKGKKFLPHILVVTSGSTVTFPNRDDIFHNVFAEYRAKKFDLGMYPKGQTRTVTFDKTGVVSVLCNVHSNMSAYIVVVDTPFFAKSDDLGRFQIPNVPDSKLTIDAWHESGATYKGTWSGGPIQINLGK
jgi:plastocyanin